MLDDICTCPVSLGTRDALEAWNGVVLGILTHGQSAGDHLARLIALEPEFAMGQAMKGLACLMLGRREMQAVAVEANRAAQAALAQGGATPREQLWCMALNDWIEGYPSRSVSRMEEALRLNPADTISMKLSHGIRFMLGDSKGMRRSIENVIGAHGSDHQLYGYALGCLSFAQEETGSYAEAERNGLKALEFANDDAWGLHAVAHVYDMTGHVDRGISLIDSNGSAWSHCNNFRFHVWWHKALLHLDKGDFETALSLYDTKIRDEKSDDFRDFSNASSLLVRLELEGANVGQRWEELSQLAEKRSEDGCLVFADMHYMLALSGEKHADAANRLIANVAHMAQGQTETAHVMQSPGVSTAEGLAAFGEGHYEAAFAKLSAAQPHFQDMGGSHAQRDVFERLTIEAGLRSGAIERTEALLNARSAMRDGARDSFAISRLERIAQARTNNGSFAAE